MRISKCLKDRRTKLNPMVTKGDFTGFIFLTRVMKTIERDLLPLDEKEYGEIVKLLRIYQEEQRRKENESGD